MYNPRPRTFYVACIFNAEYGKGTDLNCVIKYQLYQLTFVFSRNPKVLNHSYTRNTNATVLIRDLVANKS